MPARIFAAAIFLVFSTGACGQLKESPLTISHLKGDFYVFTTFGYFKGTRFPANGMYVVTKQGVVMIDSPWDSTQFQPLLDSIQKKHNRKVVMCLPTHFHDDRTGGLEYYRKQGIKTYSTRRTDQLSLSSGMKRAEYLFGQDTVFKVGDHSFQTFYPGHGHAPDNIVIWFEKEKILYGGCLIKSAEDKNLGNLGDADINSYASTIENVMRHFKNPVIIVPGHGPWTSIKSIDNTLNMARQLKQH